MQLPAAAEAHRRLYPSLADPNYLVLRSRRLIFSKWAAELGKKELTILDIGGRLQPYRPLLDGHIRSYVAVDLVKTEFVSVVADGQALPFRNQSFDMVIATQVFEYFKDPCLAAKQMHAVLKPGGLLFASLAACAPRFVDDEHWRFTRTGLQSMFAPFANVEIVPEVHSLAGVLRTVNVSLGYFLPYRWARSLYRLTVCPVLNIAGLCVENLNLSANDQFTANYSVRARKAA